MTPLRGFMRKIVRRQPTDDDTSTEPSRQRNGREPDARHGARGAATSGAPDASADREAGGGKRRRGRRGGRGRNRAGGDQPQEQRTTTDTTEQRPSTKQRPKAQNGTAESDSAGARRGRGGRGRRGGRNASNGSQGDSRSESGATPRNYAWGKKVDQDESREARDRRRPDRRRSRSFRPLREHLDAPLPEDLAFRASTEGGDGSLLPNRRRRPSGLRDTERVLLGGARSLSGFARNESIDLANARLASDQPRDSVTLGPLTEATRDLTVEDAAGDERPEGRDAEPANGTQDAAPETSSGASPRVEGNATPATSVADETDDDTDAESDRPRRRRGRRGGRGRSRRQVEDASTNGATNKLTEARDAIEADEAEPEPRASDVSDAPARSGRKPRPKVAAADFPPAFRALGMSDTALSAIASFGFSEPTPIQERSIPALLAGHDVVGVAQTGSGKTVAFGIPMMERLDADLADVQAIVLVPTRELAQQVLEVLSDLAQPFGLEAVGLLGGRALDRDFRALERRPAIVVGTPGRVKDHLQRGTLSLRQVRYAVLDEADQMLDIGFLPDIRRILSRTPKRRQTALFSATMPTSIKRLIWQFMDDPETVSVDAELATVESVEQIYFEVAQRDKTRGLRELVERELKGRTLVFCKMKRGVDRLAGDLQRDGVRVGALHGDMDQRRRDSVVQRFRDGELDILIATNVAARGLDIPEITHVVNFDVPQNAEEYVHRIGRTGRAGREGKAITFVCEWDVSEFDTLLGEFGEQLHKETLELYAIR